jgi:rRNA maturation protein Nop10
MNRIRYCESCRKYTLEETCSCGGKSVVRKPPHYSPVDRMAVYRQKARKDDLKSRGLL